MNTANAARLPAVLTAGATLKSPAGKPAVVHSLSCPRCTAGVARRWEETEWITLYRCLDCNWKFAKRR